jgi:hypothetical protein
VPSLVLNEDPFDAEIAYDLPRTGSKFEDWRAELDAFYREMRKFESFDPHSVFMRLSAFSARASEMRAQLARDDSRRALALRTKEVEPFLDECDRQFKYHSRAQAVSDMEFRLSGGAT